MQLEKVLLAGPWIGEFGWELFCWHAYVRALSRNFDKTIIVSSKHSEFLYKDFCDKFISFDPEDGGQKDSYYKIGFNETKQMWSSFFKQAGYNQGEQRLTVFTPRRIGDPPRTHFSEAFEFGPHKVKPEYLMLGNKKEKYKNTIVIHARSRNLRPEDNWSEKKWKKLVDKIDKTCYTIICIGLKNEALHIEGTTDMRECNQEELLNLLNSSICVLGPSSGAMHLASLCGCPQIVWSTQYNHTRYTKNWNPFDTKVVFLSEHGWQPEPEYVYENFRRFVSESN